MSFRRTRPKHQLLSISEMSKADRLTIKSGIPGAFLMQRAGAGVAETAEALNLGPSQVVLIAGPGNNGGDAFVAANELNQRGFPVELYLLGKVAQLKGDASLMAARFIEAGGEIKENAAKQNSEPLLAALRSADIIIDGLFGAGLDRPLEGKLLTIVKAINEQSTQENPATVIAIDIPSGIHGDTGQVMGGAIQAHHTVTFCRPKPGHYLYPGRAHCGELTVTDIGIPERIVATLAPQTALNTPLAWQAALISPPADSHKYNNGAALVVCGDPHMLGATTLAANAAAKTGAGLVTLALPAAAKPSLQLLTAIMTAELNSDPRWADLINARKITAALYGPGAPPEGATRTHVTALAKQPIGLVLDAGALSAFAEQPDDLFKLLKDRAPHPTILTPHEGEFARLFGPAIQQHGKLAATKEAASKCGAILILKGADTVIAAPDGRALINCTAPPTLATAGTGDVLAGMSTALLAQKIPAFEAAAAAVWLHAKAATLLGRRMVADDLIDHIPHALKSLEE